MTFKLGLRSRFALRGVHPDLVRVVERALKLTLLDFSVHEGLRSPQRQAELVATGASRTLASRHLTGHAVDIVPLIGGKKTWDWPAIFRIVPAVAVAAKELGTPVRWGGVWKLTSDLDVSDLEGEMANYIARKKAEGKKPFPDGAHFELPRESYPSYSQIDQR